MYLGVAFFGFILFGIYLALGFLDFFFFILPNLGSFQLLCLWTLFQLHSLFPFSLRSGNEIISSYIVFPQVSFLSLIFKKVYFSVLFKLDKFYVFNSSPWNLCLFSCTQLWSISSGFLISVIVYFSFRIFICFLIIYIF